MNLTRQHLLFCLVVALLFTACDAGKFYARKKIDHHYEEVSEYKKTTDLVVNAEQPTKKEAINITDNKTPTENNVQQAVTSPIVTPVQKVQPVVADETTPSAQVKKISQPASLSVKTKKAHQSSSAAGSRGLAFILIALLLLLLGLLFLAVLGAFGLVLWIIFLIAACIYLVVGLIMLLSGN